MAIKIGNLRMQPSRRGWTILAVCALALSSYTADAVASIGRVRSGVQAGTLELGGQNGEEARALLSERAELLVSEPVELFADEHRVSVAPSEISFRPNVEGTLEDAMAVGRRGNLIVRTWHRVRTLFARTDVGWHSTFDREAANLVVTDWATRIDTEGHEAGIEARGVTLVPVGPVSGQRLDREGAIRTMIDTLETWPRQTMELPIAVRERRTTLEDAEQAAEIANRLVESPVMLLAPDDSRHVVTRAQLAGMLEAVPRRRGGEWRLHVQFSPERVEGTLGERMKPFEAEPRSASFAVQGTRASVVAGEDGRKFDPAGTARALDSAARRTNPREAQAAFAAVEPSLTTQAAQDLRIKELVSTFTTNFPCCQPRVGNIQKIASAVDGAIVRPGATFSVNGHVGPRTTEKGYVLAPMIFDGEFRDDVGGGVSQFATTMFNAIFFGGYKLESYKAHSYYISRYPAGREATISWPHPDLRFTNNSSSGILIKASASSTAVSVSFYGDKEGRAVTAEAGPRTNFTEPPEQRKANPALPPGEERVMQRGAQGFDVVVWRVINRDGRETRERFFTRYKPQPTIIEYGPGEPTPTPEEEAEEGEGEPTEGDDPRRPRRPGTTPEPEEAP